MSRAKCLEQRLTGFLKQDAVQFTIEEIEDRREELAARYPFGILAFRRKSRGWSCEFALLGVSPTDAQMEEVKKHVLDPLRKDGWTVVCVTGDVAGYILDFADMVNINVEFAMTVGIENPFAGR